MKSEPSALSAAAHKSVITAFYDLMNKRRFDDMWTLFDPEATWGGGGNPPKLSAGIEHMKTVIVDPMPIFVTGGIRFTIHSMISEDDSVAAEVESYAELVNGRVYNNSYHMLFRFRGSLIIEVKEYADTLHAKEVFAATDTGS